MQLGWFYRVFWVNIAKSEVNLRYRNCSKLFGILRREIEFRYYRYRNSTKSMREKKKKVERENIEFRQRGYRISCAQFCCLCVECPKWKEKKNFWQTNCDNAIAEIEKKKICNNCGNGIVENGGKKMWFRNLGRVKKKVLHSQYFSQ